ncbi:MAG: argininosuccinate lyase, partial [Brevibacterium sp.]|nr:argininosuccinate lyase [Brevibacterium sp.]
AESKDAELWDLSDEDFASISEYLTPDVREVLTTLGSIDSRNAKGGTARSAVEAQIANAKAEVAKLREFAGSARSV